MTGIIQQQETAKHALDSAIGAGALSSPWWLPVFNTWTNVALVLGGIILLGLRIAIAWREWRSKRG